MQLLDRNTDFRHHRHHGFIEFTDVFFLSLHPDTAFFICLCLNGFKLFTLNPVFTENQNGTPHRANFVGALHLVDIDVKVVFRKTCHFIGKAANRTGNCARKKP